MNVSSASPLTSEQYWKTPSCLVASVSPSPPADQCVNATCWPSGKVAPSSSSEVHGAAMNLSRKSSLPVNLSGDRLDLVHLRRVVGDGLVVPEDRVAVLEVVHERLELGAVVGVELARERRGRDAGLVPVRAERRRGGGVVDRGAGRHVVLVAVGLLGLDVLADRGGGADVGDRPGRRRPAASHLSLRIGTAAAPRMQDGDQRRRRRRWRSRAGGRRPSASCASRR